MTARGLVDSNDTSRRHYQESVPIARWVAMAGVFGVSDEVIHHCDRTRDT